MTIDIFGGAMHHNIRAQLQRLLKVGAGKSIIDYHEQVPVMGQRRDSLDIDQSKQRIRWSFQPDHFRVWTNSFLIIRYLVRGHIAELDVVATHHPLKNAVGAPVGVIARNDMIARAEQTQDSRFRSHAGGKRQSICALFERSDTCF